MMKFSLKNRLVQVFIIQMLIFACFYTRAQEPDPHFTDKVARHESQIFQKSARFTEADDYAAFDLTYQQLKFTVDPAVNFISGSVFSSLTVKENTGYISFDLNNVMVVDSVYYNGEKISFTHQSDKIKIVLPVEAGNGTKATVEIFYHGMPPQSGMGSFVASNHSGSPVIWTLSEPYGAKDWWPCKESLQDKIDSVDIYITCPQQYLGASNGKLIENKVVGQNNVSHWKHKYPIATYLVGIAVTNYQTYSDFLELNNGQKIEVLNYVYPEYLETAKSQSANILYIMSFYNKKFITYPFAGEKYGHAQFGWGGGMEHQTMSFVTSFDFELVAHEMAHQWFGDYITLASWHDIWLNEGFATYLTGLTYENLLNGQYWSRWKNNQVNRITSANDGSVYVADTTDINRIFNGQLSYSKGAYLLHMLRWEMGDTKFFNGLNNYLSDKSVAYGFASQEKFVKHMEAAADTSFTGFFNDWYYGEGFPVYRIVYYIDITDNGKQKVRISQSPSNPSVAFFEMHIPLRVWKNDTYKDIRLYNTSQDQVFTIADSRVDKIEFDPDKWLAAKSDLIDAVIDADQTTIQIIPEYASGNVRILIPEQSGNARMRLMDINGRIRTTCRLETGINRVNLGNLPNGIYIVEIDAGGKKTVKKLLWNN